MISLSAPHFRQTPVGQTSANTARVAAGVLIAILLAALPGSALAQARYAPQSSRGKNATTIQSRADSRFANAKGLAAKGRPGDAEEDPCFTPDGRPLPPLTLKPGEPQVICPGQAVLLPPDMRNPVVVSPRNWGSQSALPEDDRIRPEDIIGRIEAQTGPFAKPPRPDITPDNLIGRVTLPSAEPYPDSREDKLQKFLLARPTGFASLPWKTHADIAVPLDFKRVGKPGAVTFYSLPEQRLPTIAGLQPDEVIFGFVGLRLGWGAVRLHDSRQLDLINRAFTQTYGEPVAYGHNIEENVWEWEDVVVRTLHSQHLGVPVVIYEYSPLTTAFRSELDPLLGVEDIWRASAEPITKPQPLHTDDQILQDRLLREAALVNRQRDLLTGAGLAGSGLEGQSRWSGLNQTGVVPGLAAQPGLTGVSRMPGQSGSRN